MPRRSRYFHTQLKKTTKSPFTPPGLYRSALSVLTITLTACTTNVKFDDAEYRSVGQTKPINSTLANQKDTTYESPKRLQYEADGYQQAGNLTLRYGHDLTIRKIIQTIRIHCQAQPLSRENQADEEPLQFCHYQFPDYCGSHRFSLIENAQQTALVYHDRKSQRNILDQVQDSQYAQPGLWDFADQVSVSSPYPEQQLYYQFSGQSTQAWLVGLNESDRAEYGTRYAKASNETLACF